MLSDVKSWLTQSVLIEYPAVSGFDQSTTWTTRATVDGYIWALSGNESIDYGGDNVRSTHRAVMPVTTITEADRVTAGGKIYLVRYVDTKSISGDTWLQVDLEYVGAAS